MLNIHPAHAFKDNYIWVVHNQNYAVVIDPGITTPVIEYLQLNKLQLCAILITHHHNDHTGGIAGLIQRFDIPVYGPSNELITAITNPVQQNDIVNLPDISLNLTVLDTPGHTRGHIAYYGSDPWDMIFCGDTLFSCGCGRIFEGSAAQLYQTLQKISQLPDATLIYCAHEYTLGNIEFAKAVDPKNKKLYKFAITAEALRHKNMPTIPTTLALEKTINPFLRCEHQPIINSVQNYSQQLLQNSVDIFAVLREWKNKF